MDATNGGARVPEFPKVSRPVANGARDGSMADLDSVWVRWTDAHRCHGEKVDLNSSRCAQVADVKHLYMEIYEEKRRDTCGLVDCWRASDISGRRAASLFLMTGPAGEKTGTFRYHNNGAA